MKPSPVLTPIEWYVVGVVGTMAVLMLGVNVWLTVAAAA